ncbi:C-type mannose receptor 2 [Helicoverpa armigera]|uniref:C-type mannose receptor 2 n=1 Tax=Helicoverpa armigera TaxID=29058 RepID=UPI0030831B9F
MFFKTIVFLIVYFSADFSNGQRENKFFREDYTYIDEGKGFYKIHQHQQTWFAAKVVCAREGASLFFPENDAEAMAVVAFWERTAPSRERMLLGMSELLVTGDFVTIDGRPVTEVYNNWKPGEPNHLGGDEHCVNWHKGGVLNDCPCDYRDDFICKKSIHTLEWNYLCNMSNMDYTYNRDAGKCYKVHTTPVTWTEAKAICEAEQTQLAVINNKADAEYLASLIESTPTPRTADNYMRGVYHMGFHNTYGAGWFTVKDLALTASPDMWWGNNIPKGDYQCGSMFFNGQLNNIDCSTSSFFICEHEAQSNELL